jgi:hypothetical protein
MPKLNEAGRFTLVSETKKGQITFGKGQARETEK